MKFCRIPLREKNENNHQNDLDCENNDENVDPVLQNVCSGHEKNKI
jgi:hypothetical protein